MPKAMSKTITRGGRKSAPVKTTTKKAARVAKPAAKGPVDTREGLIIKMGAIMDKVDQALPKMREIYWSWPQGQLRGLYDQVGPLTTRMAKLLAPGKDETPEWIFTSELRAEPGTVPTPARPGYFIEWVGYIPVLCCWGGFLSRNAEIRMIDPAEQWVNDTGYKSLQLRLEPKALDVRALFRRVLIEATTGGAFKLHNVTETGRDKAVALLAEHEWLREALDKGPVDPIPFPASMQAVQQSLFV